MTYEETEQKNKTKKIVIAVTAVAVLLISACIFVFVISPMLQIAELRQDSNVHTITLDKKTANSKLESKQIAQEVAKDHDSNLSVKAVSKESSSSRISGARAISFEARLNKDTEVIYQDVTFEYYLEEDAVHYKYNIYYWNITATDNSTVQKVQLPDIANLKSDAAKAQLEALGFKVDTHDDYDSAPLGTVLGYYSVRDGNSITKIFDPKAGDYVEVMSDGEIIIKVSKGPEPKKESSSSNSTNYSYNGKTADGSQQYSGDDGLTYYKNKDGSVEVTDGYGNVMKQDSQGRKYASTDSGRTWKRVY